MDLESPNIAPPTPREHHPYRGFVAGVFSGIAKLSVGHPFDTIKVRLQTSAADRFSGPLDCLLKTVRNEGIRGVYKGATPPLVGWMFMDSVMLGSLSQYRALLKKHVFPNRPELPDFAHGIAGMGAGATVSFIAAPVEHVKARLQVQYHGRKTSTPASSSASSSSASTTTAIKPRYSGPIDCTRQLLSQHGIRGLYHGLSATLFFRSFFFFWWSSYAVLTREFRNRTSLSEGAINFWAGGLSAQVFWLTCYPSDVVKQKIMTDDLDNRRYRNWMQAAKAVYKDAGWRGYWRGFVPCFLRAFPANAMALLAFEGVMRGLP